MKGNDILLESFEIPTHEWIQMNDPVMGGKSTGSFSVENNVGIMDGHVANVPFLNAPGFIKAETSTNGAGEWPDISSCRSLKFNLMTSKNYTGYRVSFGKNKPPDSFPYIYGYKADIQVPLNSFEDVEIDFNDFSYDWDPKTGDQITTCAQNPSNCPNRETLQNLYSIAVWAEGVEGDANLEIRSIHASGCEVTNTDSFDVKKQITESISLKEDEIFIEDFSNPYFSWLAKNDPVMGGRSSSTVSMQNDLATFQGEVVDVPFLHAPGFIMMRSSGVFPDISSCNAIKLVIKSNYEYDGYRIGFGDVHLPGSRHARGYKAPFQATENFGDVVIPYENFSSKWNEATGDIIIECTDDQRYCPDTDTLRNIKTMSIWGEGVGGVVDLEVQSISAIGCLSTRVTSSSANSPNLNSNIFYGGIMVMIISLVLLSYGFILKLKKKHGNYEEIGQTKENSCRKVIV